MAAAQSSYADIKALTDAELYAAYDAEEDRIGSRSDADRRLYLRLANEISYRAGNDDVAAERAERRFGC